MSFCIKGRKPVEVTEKSGIFVIGCKVGGGRS